jgi:hypothetical protein
VRGVEPDRYAATGNHHSLWPHCRKGVSEAEFGAEMGQSEAEG